MNTKYILLVIGILGVLASILGVFQGRDLSSNITGFICGASLIWGYFELKKKEENE